MPNFGGMNGTPGGGGALGYENPAFKIKIVAPNDALQQRQGRPRPNPANSIGDNLREGQPVTARIAGEEIAGIISAIHKNGENDVTFVEIKDNKGNVHKVDISRLGSADKYDEDIPDNLSAATSSPAVFAESRFLSFPEFSNL